MFGVEGGRCELSCSGNGDRVDGVKGLGKVEFVKRWWK